MIINLSILLISLFLAAWDIKYKKVPNITILVLLILTIISYVFEPNGLLTGIFTAIGVFIFLMFIYIMFKGRIGMGDIKYLTLIGFKFGFTFFVGGLFYSSLIALVVVLLLILLKKVNSNQPIPFMPFLVTGLLIEYILPLTNYL